MDPREENLLIWFSNFNKWYLTGTKFFASFKIRFFEKRDSSWETGEIHALSYFIEEDKQTYKKKLSSIVEIPCFPGSRSRRLYRSLFSWHCNCWHFLCKRQNEYKEIVHRITIMCRWNEVKICQQKTIYHRRVLRNSFDSVTCTKKRPWTSAFAREFWTGAG